MTGSVYPVGDFLPKDERYFECRAGFVPVCGGPCTDWTFGVAPGAHYLIVDFLGDMGFNPDKVREVLEQGGELPIHPYGEGLRDYMLEAFGDPARVWHGSQGLNASLLAERFGFFPVNYGHRISGGNIATLRERNPQSIELIDGIAHEKGSDIDPVSVTVNIRTNYPERSVDAYLSDAAERNYPYHPVQENLRSSEVRIKDALEKSKGKRTAVLATDIQVLGHSLSRAEFQDYLGFMSAVADGIRRMASQYSGRIVAMTDCGGLNAYTDDEVMGLWRSIYGSAPVLACNENEATRLAKAICSAESVSPTTAAGELLTDGVGSVWMHTENYQAFVTRDRNLNPQEIATALLFSGIAAGSTLQRQELVGLDYLRDVMQSGIGFVEPDVTIDDTDQRYLLVTVPSMRIERPPAVIGAGDAATLAMLHALLSAE